MQAALDEAKIAGECGEIPIGAVIVRDGEIIGRGHNMVETDNDPTHHAEIMAIRDACSRTGYKRLTGCTMYVTCEPCHMCAGAMVLARLDRAVIGTMDPKAGAAGSLSNVLQDMRLNHRMEIETGVLADECAAIMKDFFRQLRTKRSEDISK